MKLISKDGNTHGRKIGEQNIEVGNSPVEVDDDIAATFLNMTSGLVEIVPDLPEVKGDEEDLPPMRPSGKSKTKAVEVVEDDDLPVYEKEEKPKAKKSK